MMLSEKKNEGYSDKPDGGKDSVMINKIISITHINFNDGSIFYFRLFPIKTTIYSKDIRVHKLDKYIIIF